MRKMLHSPPSRKRSATGWHSSRRLRRAGYVLLETVIATGVLILGLTVIGAQVQDAHRSIKRMELRTRAMMLAEVQLAEMGLGLIELDSVDEEQEEEFGRRWPDWGWRMILDETDVDTLYLLTLEVLFWPREDFEEKFDFDEAEVVHTLYTFRTAPQKLDLCEAFGIPEDEMEKLAERLAETGIEGLDPTAFDPTVLTKLEFEELIEILPTLLEAFRIDLGSLLVNLPPDVRDAIEGAGAMDLLEDELDGGGEGR